MKRVLSLHSHPLGLEKNDNDAAPEEVQRFFATEMTEIFRLALHLAADVEKAESCVIWAMRDCFERSTVSRKWLPIWARRMVVRNAIRLVLGIENGIPGGTGVDIYLQPSDRRADALRESSAILQLPDVDRMALVICILERYSVLDCALLLRKSPKEVQDAIVRAVNQIASEEQHHNRAKTQAGQTNSYSVCRAGEFDFNGSRGVILNSTSGAALQPASERNDREGR